MPKDRGLPGEVFLEEIRQRGWKPRAIGGLTMGADPIVVAVSVVSGELDGFLVRKAENSTVLDNASKATAKKAHG